MIDIASMANAPQKPQKKPQKPRREVKHKVKEWRDFRGYSQETLAEMVGKTRGLISQIEIGETDLTGEMIYALSNALKITPGDLLKNDPESDTIFNEVRRHLEDADKSVQREVLGYVRGRTRKH